MRPLAELVAEDGDLLLVIFPVCFFPEIAFFFRVVGTACGDRDLDHDVFGVGIGRYGCHQFDALPGMECCHGLAVLAEPGRNREAFGRRLRFVVPGLLVGCEEYGHGTLFADGYLLSGLVCPGKREFAEPLSVDRQARFAECAAVLLQHVGHDGFHDPRRFVGVAPRTAFALFEEVVADLFQLGLAVARGAQDAVCRERVFDVAHVRLREPAGRRFPRCFVAPVQRSHHGSGGKSQQRIRGGHPIRGELLQHFRRPEPVAERRVGDRRDESAVARVVDPGVQLAEKPHQREQFVFPHSRRVGCRRRHTAVQAGQQRVRQCLPVEAGLITLRFGVEKCLHDLLRDPQLGLFPVPPSP